jgi:hypothetical protein
MRRIASNRDDSRGMTVRAALAGVLVAVAAIAASVPVASAAPPSRSADLHGTRACAPAPPYVYSVRVRAITCRRGRAIATYWETEGRGSCPRGWRTRRYERPAGTVGLGGHLLNCHRGRRDVYWVEGGE